MTKDEFRMEQKKMCFSGAPNKCGIYGCPCCRDISHLGKFKKFSRKLAKARLKRATRKEIEENS